MHSESTPEIDYLKCSDDSLVVVDSLRCLGVVICRGEVISLKVFSGKSSESHLPELVTKGLLNCMVEPRDLECKRLAKMVKK